MSVTRSAGVHSFFRIFHKIALLQGMECREHQIAGAGWY